MLEDATPSPASPSADPAQLEAYMAMLAEIGRVGMNIVRSLEEHRAGISVSDRLSVSDRTTAYEGVSRAFGRVTRALRLSILLHAKLNGERLSGGLAPERRAASNTGLAPVRRGDDADALKAHALGIVQRAGERDGRDPDQVEREAGDYLERLEDEDADILNRPADEVIALICNALGLDPARPDLAGQARAQEPWAQGLKAGTTKTGQPWAAQTRSQPSAARRWPGESRGPWPDTG